MINTLLNKSAIAALLLVSLSACIPDKNQQKTAMPFQCISSQTACEINTEFGTFLIKFNVEQVLTELPFELLVQLKQDDTLNEKTSDQSLFEISGYMEGKTMFMGKIPLFFAEKPARLDKTGKEASGNRFIAETMLGSCSQEIMTWRVWLTVKKQTVNEKNKQSTFFIDFNSTRY